ASAGIHLQHAAGLPPQPADLLNRIAWVFSTDAEPRLRDGVRAVELARRACDGKNRDNPRFLSTLAAAQAEAGNFNDAVATATKALDFTRQALDSVQADAL